MALKLFDSERKVMEQLWEKGDRTAKELAEDLAAQVGWSKTTTYTVIKRLSERGVVQNKDTVVTALISKEQAQIAELDELMDKKFEGSLPAFLAAFTRQQHLSDRQIAAIRRIIDEQED